MAQDGVGASPGSEHLARLYFTLAREGDVPNLLEFLHPEIELTLKTRGGAALHGKEEVARYLAEVADSRTVFESTAERFRVVDDERVVVEGRMRWMDEERILRDDPVVWALEFRDGLLVRSIPTRSVGEAQAILAAGATRPRRNVEAEPG